MRNIDRIRQGLDPERERKIRNRADELITHELSLRNLRQAHRLTQKAVGKKLGVTQDQVSKIEKRSDLLISTLRKYVEGMGGELLLMAEFRDRSRVLLSGIGDASDELNDRESKSARPYKPGTPEKTATRR